MEARRLKTEMRERRRAATNHTEKEAAMSGQKAYVPRDECRTGWGSVAVVFLPLILVVAAIAIYLQSGVLDEGETREFSIYPLEKMEEDGAHYTLVIDMEVPPAVGGSAADVVYLCEEQELLRANKEAFLVTRIESGTPRNDPTRLAYLTLLRDGEPVRRLRLVMQHQELEYRLEGDEAYNRIEFGTLKTGFEELTLEQYAARYDAPLIDRTAQQ